MSITISKAEYDVEECQQPLHDVWGALKVTLRLIVFDVIRKPAPSR